MLGLYNNRIHGLSCKDFIKGRPPKDIGTYKEFNEYILFKKFEFKSVFRTQQISNSIRRDMSC